MRALFIILLLSASLAPQAQNPLNGFRGWDWGSDYLQLSDQLERSSLRVSGYKTYVRKGDCKTFEGLIIGETTYLFKKDKLSGVQISINPNDFERMTEFLSEDYGNYKNLRTQRYQQLTWQVNGALIELSKVIVGSNIERASVKIIALIDEG